MINATIDHSAAKIHLISSRIIQSSRCSTKRLVKEGHLRMSAAHSSANSTLLGNKECVSVSRALSELQARRPIRISASGESLLALPVDGLDERRLNDFAVLCSPNALKLVVTEQRARSIGIKASTAMVLPLSRVVGVSTIFDLAANGENEGHFQNGGGRKSSCHGGNPAR